MFPCSSVLNWCGVVALQERSVVALQERSVVALQERSTICFFFKEGAPERLRPSAVAQLHGLSTVTRDPPCNAVAYRKNAAAAPCVICRKFYTA